MFKNTVFENALTLECDKDGTQNLEITRHNYHIGREIL